MWESRRQTKKRKKPCVRWVSSLGIRQILPLVANGKSPPVSFVLKASPCRSTVRDSRPAHLRSRRSFAHWASASLFRSGASWGSPPVRRCQTVHRTVRLAAPPLLTHWQRSPCSTVRNGRIAALPLASLVAHWASGSLSRSGASWGSPPVRRCQIVHWTIWLAAPPLLTHRTRSEVFRLVGFLPARIFGAGSFAV